MNRPVVGVKLCGGCKEQYDRIQAWKQIQADCPEIEFVPAARDVTYDLVLVISGCFTQCPDIKRLRGREGLLRVCTAEQIALVTQKIRELAKGL